MFASLLLAVTINWTGWNDAVFAQAKRENKFVLLDLQAVWCHWCHVMDEMTYADPDVIALMNARYIAVKVDQDSRPDLANRYEDYGWPATIVFSAGGSEIVKRRGYIPPKQMASMLKAIIDDPSPGPSVVPEPKISFGNESLLSDALRKQLEQVHRETYDAKNGGWGFSHKYLDAYSVEYALARGDTDNRRMARQTLDGERNLLDSAWGGVYQYSTGGVWSEPHYEKIMEMQAANLRVAAQAYALWGDPKDLATAQSIRRYLNTFLRGPDGAFYTSQNADLVDGEHSAEYFALPDSARRAKGIPRIDKHVYARENGWAAEALIQLAAATGDRAPLDEARTALQWIHAHRRRAGGGLNHGFQSTDPYLGDTLAMARAELALYGATGERVWLARAQDAAAFIDRMFRGNPGYLTARPAGMMPPKYQRAENIDVARFANLLYHYDGDPKHLAMAKNAMRYLAADVVAKEWPTGGVLLADLEMRSEPLHVTVVGAKRDAAAQSLFRAAARIPAAFKQVEWFDRAEGPLPNAKVEYPALKKPAAFLCNGNSCSRPAFTAVELQALVARLAP